MDIEYLLFLQDIRNASGDLFAPFFLWLTDFSVSLWPIILMYFVYWTCDRNVGKRLIFGHSGALLMNGFLKLVCCVNRPWIRCDEIEPYGDVKGGATGYSFPSGHSTNVTSIFGGIGFWQRKKHIVITIVSFAIVVLTMFSRNYLGVHTPQDVIVGCLAAIVMMILANFIESWTDKNIKRDLYVIIGGLLLCVVLIIFYETKSYPLVYNDAGELLVDPKKMIADSFEGIGAISAYVICRYFERRYFDFEKILDWKSRFVVATICSIPLIWWFNHCIDLVSNLLNRNWAKFLYFFVGITYAMIVVPAIMKKVSGKMLETENNS